MNDEIHPGRMDRKRWNELMDVHDATLTAEEFAHGWHWCPEWDGLVVGPGMEEFAVCVCRWEDPEIQKRVDVYREAERKLTNEIFGELGIEEL